MLRTYFVVVALLGFAVLVFGDLPDRSGGQRNAAIGVNEQPQAPPQSVELPPRASQTVNELDQSIELTREPNGYFYAEVQINGAPIHMVVDTGASDIALSRNDAQMAGIPTSIAMNDVVGRGADGLVKGQQVTLDRVTLGGKTENAVPAIVLSSGGQSLLGQSFLSKFASVKIEGDTMVLR
jgi:aspartyl protease family protein